jgi:POT family proton-dependent oligopeptide transporter
VPDQRATGASAFRLLAATTPLERKKLAGILVMSLFTVVYAIAFYQKFGLLSLFVQSSVERHVLGFEIPVSWLLSVSTTTFLLSAPLVGGLLTRRAQRGKPVDPATSLTFGLGSLVCGYVLLILVVQHFFVAQGAKVPVGWMVASYAFFGVGDVFIWPAQLAIVTALAPRSMTSFAVGSWYVTVGAGNYIAGIVGAWGDGAGVLPMLAGVLAMLITAIVAVQALRGWFAARCSLDG